MVDWPYQTAQDRTDAMIGTNDSNNTQSTSSVASNADGSVVERLEYIQTTQAVPTADATTDTLTRDVVGRKTDAAITTVGTTKTLMAYLKGLLGGFGAPVNTGGTATLAAILGDLANSSLVTRLNLLQALTPATFVPGLGFRITKTENVNTATGVDLFTVTGKVLIRLWTLEVTNALHTTVNDYKLRIKTDNVDLCAAGDLSSAAVGYMTQLNSDAGDTILAGTSYAVSAVKTSDTNGKGFADRIVGLAGGSCTLQSLRTAGASGDEIIHVMFYMPLEASAAVVAA